MKAYLGIRDLEGADPGRALFGIDRRERNFARIRVA
jgi:hypothetical protein